MNSDGNLKERNGAMNISSTSMTGFGLSAYSRTGKPLEIISTRHHHKTQRRAVSNSVRDVRSSASNQN